MHPLIPLPYPFLGAYFIKVAGYSGAVGQFGLSIDVGSQYGCSVPQPGSFTFTSGSFQLSEAAGTDVSPITIHRTGGSEGTVAVRVQTVPGSAFGQNRDYMDLDEEVVFASGETSKTVSVQVVRDHHVEATEYFSLVLSLTPTSGSAMLGNISNANISIADDAANHAILFTNTSVFVTENAGSVQLEVYSPRGPATVHYRTEAGSAVPGVDFNASVGQLEFPSGGGLAMIRIGIIDNVLATHITKSFTVSLVSVTVGSYLSNGRYAQVNIVEDDIANVCSNGCSGHGSCSDVLLSPLERVSCECQEGFSGDTCDIEDGNGDNEGSQLNICSTNDLFGTTVGAADGEMTYRLNLTAPASLVLSLCSDMTDYDTYMWLDKSDNQGWNPGATWSRIASNDDGPSGSCPGKTTTYNPSRINTGSLVPGMYLITIAGFSGSTGKFGLSISGASGCGDNTTPADEFFWELSAVDVRESSSVATRIVRQGSRVNPATVMISTRVGTATSSDYESITNRVIDFPPGL